MDCDRDCQEAQQVILLDPERIRHVVSEMYAVILAAAFVIIIKIDADPLVFYAADWGTLLQHLLPFAFLWGEWFWTEHFFVPGDSAHQVRLLINTFVHVAQLWCVCFCCVFFIRGDSSVSLGFNGFPFWFASYLFFVIFWSYLNPKRLEGFLNLMNVYVFVLFVILWRLNESFHLMFENQLKIGVIVYMVACTVLRVFMVGLLTPWLRLLDKILADKPSGDI